MQNPRYSYDPLPQRPVIEWPNKARLAVWIIPNIEHFHFDEPPHGQPASAGPDVPSYSERDYGNRVGIWRIMEILERHGCRATVALNSEVCVYEPQIISAGNALGWEWMGHGRTNSQWLTGLSLEDEKSLIEDVIATIATSTGKRPKGWLGPGRQETFNTPDVLAAAGLDYVVDWSADDLPFAMNVRSGRLLAMPYGNLTDMLAFNYWHWTGEQFYELIRDQFDTLYNEGKTRPRTLSIALHPYLVGRPHRAGWLDKALKYVVGHDDVWLATGGEIADWYIRHLAHPA